MQLKIITAPDLEKLQEKVNEFLDGLPNSEIISVDAAIMENRSPAVFIWLTTTRKGELSRLEAE